MAFEPNQHPILSRRRPSPFRPSFTLALFYLAGFFFLFSFLLVLPELLVVLRDVAPGPEQEARARDVARAALQPRLSWALGLAIGSVGLGSYLRILPGLRRP
jgi:hypothetical protein